MVATRKSLGPDLRPLRSGRGGASSGGNGRPTADRRQRGPDRRRRDGLGLLPRTLSATERQRRQRANQVVGVLLILAGGFIVGGSVALLQQQMQPEVWIALVFGFIMLAQGVILVGRRERRRPGREVGRRASDRTSIEELR